MDEILNIIESVSEGFPSYSFVKISQRVSLLLSGHDFATQIFKGHNFIKIEDGVTFLQLCTLPDGAVYIYQLSPKYIKGFQNY